MQSNSNDLYQLCDKLTDDIAICTKLLVNYNSDDWDEITKDIKKSDSNCNNYHKITIYKNNLVEVYLIVWFDNALTPIHDHPDGGCLVKIIKGRLIEDVYQNVGNSQAIHVKSNILNQLDINYKTGNKILHQIKANEYSVSLHIYFPPNYTQTIYTSKT